MENVNFRFFPSAKSASGPFLGANLSENDKNNRLKKIRLL
jgi:hypothetical protein